MIVIDAGIYDTNDDSIALVVVPNVGDVDINARIRGIGQMPLGPKAGITCGITYLVKTPPIVGLAMKGFNGVFMAETKKFRYDAGHSYIF